MSEIKDEAAPVSSLEMIAGLRADMYQLLAAAFAEPTPQLAAGLIDTGFQADVRSILQGLAFFGEDVAAVESGLDQLTTAMAGKDPDALYHELNIEYTRLFIAPTPVPVSLYESIYVDSTPDIPALLMVGPAAAATLEAYCEAGLSAKCGLSEPPDHIATEMEFMYYLCRQEFLSRRQQQDEEATQWRRLQHTFIVDHLGQWAMTFCCRLRDVAHEPFYALSAGMTAMFLEREGVAPDR